MVEIAKLLASVTKGNTVPAEHTDMMWSTLITGIVVVFMILVLLVLILWLLGKVLNVNLKSKASEPEKPKTVQPQTATSEAAPAEAVVEYEEDEDDGEIIAVIAAAIAAYGEANGKQYKIASVKRKEKALRGNWSAAGIHENTRPF